MGALIAVLLAVVPFVPARGDSDVPLVHVTGWYRLGPESIGGAGMFFAPIENEVAFTLPGDSYVDSYFGGSCRGGRAATPDVDRAAPRHLPRKRWIVTIGQKAGLTGALVVILALGSHVTHWSGVEGLIIPLAVIGAAVVLLGVGVQRVGARSYRVAVHTHGGHGTKLAARHEAGHYYVGQQVGATVRGAEIFPDGSGVTWVDIPCKAGPAAAVAVAVAGQVAAGTKRGCDGFKGSDFDFKRQILRSLPAAERAAVERQGYAIAQQHCKGLFSPVPAIAARIYRDGKIS